MLRCNTQAITGNGMSALSDTGCGASTEIADAEDAQVSQDAKERKKKMVSQEAFPFSSDFFASSASGIRLPDFRQLGESAPNYFHSKSWLRVLPSASTSYSNSTARLFRRAHFGELVWQYTAPR